MTKIHKDIDEEILTIGSEVNSFYLIYNGVIKCSKDKKDMYVLEKGNGFGERALLKTSAIQEEAMTACTGCELWTIEKNVFLPLLLRNFKNIYNRALNALKSNTIIKLSDKGISSLVHHFHYLYLKPGDVIFNKGEKGDFVYFIDYGEICLTRCGKYNGEVLLHQNDCFGVVSLLNNSERLSTSYARIPSGVIVIDGEYFKLLLSENKNEILENVIRSIFYSLPELNPLSTEKKQLIFEKCRKEESIKNSTVIFKKDEECNKFYLIKDGKANYESPDEIHPNILRTDNCSIGNYFNHTIFISSGKKYNNII